MKKSITAPTSFEPGMYYHIYNRGNNRENIFIEDRNYPYFLKLFSNYVEPVAETYAYCLLPNHFHFLIKVINFDEISSTGQFPTPDERQFVMNPPSRAFATLFGTYTKAINKSLKRTGSLFEKHLHRKLIQDEQYLTSLIVYIHRNHQTHGYIEDFKDWEFSSYNTILSSGKTRVKRKDVLDWFGDVDTFIDFHQREVDDQGITLLVEE